MHVPTIYEIDAGQVRALWPLYMRSGVCEALRHDTEGTLPEDVFASIMAGHSRVLVSNFDDDPTKGYEGFLVVREVFTPGGKELLVWLGYHNGDEARTADYMPQIADFARASGCNRVTIESPRPYHRAVPGMKLARHVFHYEVE